MYSTIEKIIFAYYRLNISIEGKIENGYLLKSQNNLYTLIEINKENEQILLYPYQYFPQIIPTIYQTKYFNYNNTYYCMFEYIKPSKTYSVNQYITALYHINEETIVTKKVDQSFYKMQCDMLKQKIEDIYLCFEKIINDFVGNKSMNVLFFPLIYDYEIILNMKKTALGFLNEYQELVTQKNTCRYCFCIKQVEYPAFSGDRNCFCDLSLIKLDLVTNNLIQLLKTDIEYEDLERLYLSQVSYEKHEKLYVLIELLCLEIIDFTLDGYKNIVWFTRLKGYAEKLNKIMKLLQIEKNIMYN